MTPKISSATRPYGFTRSFHVMAKPIGSICNLDCTYCYYLHKEQLLADSTKARMTEDVLANYIKQYIDSQDGGVIAFSWHGGEPMLAGLDFYKTILRLQKAFAGGKAVRNDIQTNGTLLDDNWCRFFKENRFVVGLSIDGPRDLHDEYRVSKSGNPTFDEVVRAFKLLQRFNIQFNTLTVVNRLNAKFPTEVYDFLVNDLGSRFIQFLPCVEPKAFCEAASQTLDQSKFPVLGSPGARPGNEDSIVTEWSVDPEDWGNFLCKTFDCWFDRDRTRVKVNWFESLALQMSGQKALMCVLGETCGHAVAIEKDGSVYSCDHYVYPEYRLGNIVNDDLSAMLYSPKQRKFGCDKRDTLPMYCKTCQYRSLCNGECPKNRLIKTPEGEIGLNYLCLGLKQFFRYATGRLRAPPHVSFPSPLRASRDPDVD